MRVHNSARPRGGGVAAGGAGAAARTDAAQGVLMGQASDDPVAQARNSQGEQNACRDQDGSRHATRPRLRVGGHGSKPSPRRSTRPSATG